MHGLSSVPDTVGRPLSDGSSAAARHGRKRGVQKRTVAVRADAARRRGLHTVRQLSAVGYSAAAGRGPDAVLGDAIGRVSQACGRSPSSTRRTRRTPGTGRAFVRRPWRRVLLRSSRPPARGRQRGHVAGPTSSVQRAFRVIVTAATVHRHQINHRLRIPVIYIMASRCLQFLRIFKTK